MVQGSACAGTGMPREDHMTQRYRMATDLRPKGRVYRRHSFLAAMAIVMSLGPVGTATRAEDPDRVVQPGVPKGRLTSGSFTESRIFPGTHRDYQVYVPAQYVPDKPACLMVFQDGAGYAKPQAAFRVPTVFDNLIHQGAMPVTVAVFINPGTIPPTRDQAKPRSNRSFEYDSLGDRYVRFLVEELLPVATAGLTISSRPEDRAICGISSGGICAFTAAWERPDQFGKVMSHIGSFTNIRGGWAYPGLIRKTKGSPRSLKIYLQEGRDDLDNLFGNWPLANEDMAAALAFAGYEHRLVVTDGGHSGGPGGSLLPEALRWLWGPAAPVSQETIASSQKPEQPAWEPHPDALPRKDVPQGSVEKMPAWRSTIFPSTTRDWAIYVPAQYRPEEPAALMIFQDGHSYQNPNGQWRVPVVFDNLIARGDMPPTIAVFINPGHDTSKPTPQSPGKSSNRSYEYDSLGDRYARFLLDEIIPEVEKRYRISSDPEMRAICGASSGGICSLTVAWERPDQFRKVLSTIGSFTSLRGGDVYPSLIRQTEPKPLRVYLADTSGDLDNPFGSWPIANRSMAAALRSMGYDLRFDWAEGYGHNAAHGSSLFPDALRWLWRKDRPEITVDTSGNLKGDMTILRQLLPGEGWRRVAADLGFADAACTDAGGNLYFSDMKAPAVYRVAAADLLAGRDARTVLTNEPVSGLEFGPDGMLYGCQGSRARIIRIDPERAAVSEVARDVSPNDLAISSDGLIYITETKQQQVTMIDSRTGQKSVVDTGITAPNGIALSADGGTLAVSDHRGRHVWTFRVNPQGNLDAKIETMTMRLPIDPQGEFAFHQPPPFLPASKGDGMATDASGRWYVTSSLGVQVFDPTGRHCGILARPDADQQAAPKPLTSCILAGPDHDHLVVTNGDAVYCRRLKID
jgi:enterochelin esterase-like enzyme/sugar lactone lactonase YvrE